MDAPRRIKVKYFVQNSAAVDLPAVIPVFHRWIQEHRTAGLWIDVADYKHVQQGPGIVLIGHEADLSVDMTGGRVGLVYDRKRAWGAADQEEAQVTLQARLRAVFAGALQGCQALAAEPEFQDQLRFQYQEAELSFPDRLRLPNRSENFNAVKSEIASVLDEIYGAGSYTVTHEEADERRALTVRISANRQPNFAAVGAVA